MNIVTTIDNPVSVDRVLVSVSDKTGLDTLIPGLIRINPDVKFFSTGGTFQRIAGILGPDAPDYLTQVSDYTGQPETQGGLVKTLDFKIYLGILTETYNASHTEDLNRTGAVPIDMVVVNLYPFANAIAHADATLESARANIDIGGPCMVRAAAKNYLRVASVVDPGDYTRILDTLSATGGKTDLNLRFDLARKAFAHTADYDRMIADHLAGIPLETVAGVYPDVRG
ncbi:MAG: hypothetical protein CSA22_10620 [Deltaproteobacteria bacterium]|nr:MAG: hypothetical protein CSA22_10620 [Deltaproteobacteria bacterium]